MWVQDTVRYWSLLMIHPAVPCSAQHCGYNFPSIALIDHFAMRKLDAVFMAVQSWIRNGTNTGTCAGTFDPLTLAGNQFGMRFTTRNASWWSSG